MLNVKKKKPVEELNFVETRENLKVSWNNFHKSKGFKLNYLVIYFAVGYNLSSPCAHLKNLHGTNRIVVINDFKTLWYI